MSLAPRIDSIQASRNLIINGNFDFWQRGFTFTSANAPTADRWRWSENTDGAVDVTRDTDVPTFAQSGFQSTYSLKATVATADTSLTTNQYSQLMYRMEGLDYAQLHGKPFRLQFWIKSSVAGTFSVALGNASAGRSYIAEYVINSVNTWEKKAIDFVGDTSGTWLVDNNIGLCIQWSFGGGPSVTTTAGSWQNGFLLNTTSQPNWQGAVSNTVMFSQVALYAEDFSASGGSVDLPFKRAGRSIQEELAMCQRYYEKSYPVNTPPLTSIGSDGGFIVQGSANTSTQMAGYVNFKVTKRAMPTMSHAIVTTLGQITRVNTNFNVVDTVLGGSWSPTENGATFVAGMSSTSGFVAQWMADAEI